MVIARAVGWCPVCGVAHAACGADSPTALASRVVDLPPPLPRKDAAMTETQPLKEYRVTINGIETTARLNEQDAQRLGAEPVDAPKKGKKAAPAPAPKATQPPEKSYTPANKQHQDDR